MNIQESLMISCISKSFGSFGCKVTNDMINYNKKSDKEFVELEVKKKVEYSNYAIKIVNGLISHIGDINYVDVDTSLDDRDILLLSTNNGKTCTSVTLARNKVNDIIPKKIMKICKYKKDNKKLIQYNKKYCNLNESIYKTISKYDKYSEIPEKTKQTKLYDPICSLMVDTLEENIDCASKIYTHIFSPPKMITIKIFKNKYMIYDFSVKNNIDSFEVSKIDENNIEIEFNNGAKFNLKLGNNSQEITENLSLKFHAKFQNIDDIYLKIQGDV